jgi:hypothetical protein
MSISQKAAWIIERNIDRPLTLASLADACEVSRSHLSHAFVAAAGTPVVAYLRGRRLSHAAQTLAKGAPDILAVALGRDTIHTRRSPAPSATSSAQRRKRCASVERPRASRSSGLTSIHSKPAACRRRAS